MQLDMRVVLKKTCAVAIACFLSARPALGLGPGAHLRVGHFPVIGLVRPVNEDFLLRVDGHVTVALMAALVVLTVVGLVWALKPFGEFTPRCDDAAQSQGPVEAWTFVGSSGSSGDPGRSDVLLPSGAWRGYSHERHEDFEAVEFVFQFARGGEKRPGQVTASGTDDIGQYSIAGIFEQQRIAFQKKYIWGTPALNFQVNHEQNSGHVVEYRAEWAGENLRKGIKGFWYIEEPCGSPRIRGTFHIWPAMDGWQRIPMRGTTAPPASLDHVEGPRIFPVKDTPRRYPIKVEQDQICAKCYTNPINVCLLPCGHTAICKACEQNLRHRLCPICYSPVNMIITEDGTVVKTRQASAPSNTPCIIPGMAPMPMPMSRCSLKAV